MPRRNKFLFAIELTNHCNFKCIMCPHSHYKKETKMNKFDREKGYIYDDIILPLLPKLNFRAKNLTVGFFGEPMLHPKFDYIIDLLRKSYKGLMFLNTNASLITKDNWDTVNKFNVIRISLDSHIKKTWNELCPGGAVLNWDGSKGKDRFTSLVNKIKHILKMKDRAMISIIYVTSSKNKNEVKDFVRYWKPYLKKGDKIITKSVITYGGAVFDSYMKKNPCNVYNRRRFVVAWNGDCTICNLDININMKVGNIKNQTIKEMINSEEYVNALNDIKEHKGMCVNCFDGNNHSIRYIKQ